MDSERFWMDSGPGYAGNILNGFWVDSGSGNDGWILGGFWMDSVWILCGFLVDAGSGYDGWILGGFCVDSEWILTELYLDHEWILDLDMLGGLWVGIGATCVVLLCVFAWFWMCWVDSGFDMDAECVVLHIGLAGSRREWGVENIRVMGSAGCGWTPPCALVDTLNFASKLDKGSAIKKTLGFLTKALANATLCFCPPDNSAGFL